MQQTEAIQEGWNVQKKKAKSQATMSDEKNLDTSSYVVVIHDADIPQNSSTQSKPS